MDFNDEDFSGYMVTSTTEAVKKEDGTWEVKQIVKQSRKKVGEDWETKSTNVSAFDKDLETAYKHVFISMATYLESLAGDLFNAEEDLLLEEEKM